MSYKKLEVKSPFEVEKYRHELAVARRIKELKLTYGANLPEIKNLNTGQMWDKLNETTNNTFLSNPMAHDRIKTVVGYLGEIRDNFTILDIGFGPADFERCVDQSFGKKVNIVGLDISNSSIDRAKKEYPQWRFIQGSIEKRNVEDNFDCVVALEVLEHVSPKYVFRVLNKIYRLLKNNGKFIVSVPLNERLEKLIKSGSNPNAHVRIYTKELVEAELRIARFQIIKHRFLYAFHTNYWIKSVAARLFGLGKKPNNVVLLAQKL